MCIRDRILYFYYFSEYVKLSCNKITSEAFPTKILKAPSSVFQFLEATSKKAKSFGVISIEISTLFPFFKNIFLNPFSSFKGLTTEAVSYTHLRAHETDSYLVCRLL